MNILKSALVKKGLRILLQAKKAAPPNPRNILVVAVGYLGDTVLLGPFLGALRKGYREAKISLLLESGCAPLAAACSDIDRILLFDKEKRRNPLYLIPFIIRMRRQQFDIAIIHYAHFGFEHVLFLMGISHIIGYDNDIGFASDFAYELLTQRVYKDWRKNEITNSFAFLGALGLKGEPDKRSLRVPVSEESLRQVHRILLEAGVKEGVPLIGLHIGAAAQNKKWPPSRWAQVAGHIRGKGLGTMVITGKEESLADEKAILEYAKGAAIPLCGRLSLTQLIALISLLDIMVTTDSGPKHFAYALGVPTVEIYGVSRSWRWGAYWNREIHVAIDRKADRKFDPSRVEDNGYEYCIQQITPEEVIAALNSITGAK